MAPKTLEEGSKYAHFDKDGDGVITDEEFMLEREMMRAENEDAKEDQIRKMAWFALWGLLVYPLGIIVADIVGYETTGELLADIAPTYFVAIAGLVGAFFGAQAYTKGKTNGGGAPAPRPRKQIMKNLIFQYYIPYENFDADMGGAEMPDWAHAGMRSAQKYAQICDAEYELSHDRFLKHLDPRLDSLRLFYDEYFDQFDNILCLDLDMLICTKENLFKKEIGDVAMVHELGVFTGGPRNWIKRVMDVPMHRRGIIAYGKHLFGGDWEFPKSDLYPQERFRYLNGGLQLWTKEGRHKAREHFTSIDDYVLHTRYTEQCYINLQLSQPVFNVRELDTKWNRMTYQWPDGRPDGKINHFLHRTKFEMPRLESAGFSI